MELMDYYLKFPNFHLSENLKIKISLTTVMIGFT
jgi:hypothetical protein